MIIPIVPASIVTTSKTAFWFFLASLLWVLDYAKQLMVALNPQIHCITPDYNQVSLSHDIPVELLFKSHVSPMMSILTPTHGAVSAPLQRSCRVPGGPWPAPVRHIYVTKSVGKNKGWKYAQLMPMNLFNYLGLYLKVQVCCGVFCKVVLIIHWAFKITLSY